MACLLTGSWVPQSIHEDGVVIGMPYAERVAGLYNEPVPEQLHCPLIRSLSLSGGFLSHSHDTMIRRLTRVQRKAVQLYINDHGGYTPMNLWLRGKANDVVQRIHTTGLFPFGGLLQYRACWASQWVRGVEQKVSDLPGAEAVRAMMASVPEAELHTLDWGSVDARHLTDDFVLALVGVACEALQQAIIKNGAPDKPVMVFRAVRSDLFVESDVVPVQGFLSCTNDPFEARAFFSADPDETNYLMRFFVQENTPMLPALGSRYQEREMVLPHGLHMRKLKSHSRDGFVFMDVELLGDASMEDFNADTTLPWAVPVVPPATPEMSSAGDSTSDEGASSVVAQSPAGANMGGPASEDKGYDDLLN